MHRKTYHLLVFTLCAPLQATQPQSVAQLFSCLQEGRAEQVISMVEQEPTLVQQVDKRGYPVLLAAVVHRRLSVINFLIAQKDRLNLDLNMTSEDEDQASALHLAAWQGGPEALHALLQGGADANARDAYGASPLHIAAMQGHPEALHALLQGGAWIDLQDEQGETPLYKAAQQLVACKQHRLDDDRQAIQAARAGFKEVLSTLARHGANGEIPNREARTAIELLTADGEDRLVKELTGSLTGWQPHGTKLIALVGTLLLCWAAYLLYPSFFPAQQEPPSIDQPADPTHNQKDDACQTEQTHESS